MTHSVPAPAQGELDTSAPVELTLLVRRSRPLPAGLVEGPDTISQRELVIGYGASPEDLAHVCDTVREYGFEVADIDAAARRVAVSAPASQVARVFGGRAAHASVVDAFTEQPGTYRAWEGGTVLPPELEGVVVSVIGLDTRPRLRPEFRTFPGQQRLLYTPPELGALYRFPAGTDGSGQTLAIVVTGGGFRAEDMDAYFTGLGLPVPAIRTVSVGGAQNEPGGPGDLEVVLDVQVAGALAPGADLVVYFAPNSDQGAIDALRAAIHATPTPTAISLSWGAPEAHSSDQVLRAMDDLFAEAAALGVTVCAAIGNEGSSDGVYDGGSHVNFPASSPHVLACGGTTLVGSPDTGTIESETVWNTGADGATGGGVSRFFGLPEWQASVGVPARVGSDTPGRGVPDVAANADPATGYQILFNGQTGFIGGTSAATPLWAALVCRLAQGLGRPLGLLAPLLYEGPTGPDRVTEGFRDVVAGNNGAYASSPGWDPNTGLGAPDGTALLESLRRRLGSSPAGPA
ncbi:kumamolisin [Streptomyces tendae]|uniref:S53 family peptidase n=1 Tax=Streptomyces tendae TaxID=1932 RepID=UPI001673E4A9|nr:S53 family peptidase [Streptomyces tendae]GHB11182.1 kumamolisin [Streptomyces tendae]